MSGLTTILMDTERTTAMWKAANQFAQSAMIPASFRGKPAAVFTAIARAHALGVDPFVLMDSAYDVHGRIGLEGKLIQQLMMRAGAQFDDEVEHLDELLTWKTGGKTPSNQRGNDMRVTLIGTLPDGRTKRVTISLKDAIAEDWTKSGNYGASRLMCEQMLWYRCITYFGRRYMPDVIGGLSTVDEVRALDDGSYEVNGAPAGHATAVVTKPVDPLAIAEREINAADAEAEVTQRQAREEVAAELVSTGQGQGQGTEQDEADDDGHPPNLPEGLDEDRGWAGGIERESAAMKDDPSLF